jgi:hypothetical protein
MSIIKEYLGKVKHYCGNNEEIGTGAFSTTNPLSILSA